MDIMKLVLASGADVNAQSSFRCTPIMKAFSSFEVCNVDVVRLLVDSGADVNLCDGQKRSHIIMQPHAGMQWPCR